MNTAVEKTQETNCPCCPHHCPAESPGCVRGMAHFERTITEDWLLHHQHPGGGQQQTDPSAPLPDRIVAALQMCGRGLHHGGGNAGETLACLTEQEQEELLRLLEKVQKGLQQQGGGHGGRGAGGHGHHH